MIDGEPGLSKYIPSAADVKGGGEKSIINSLRDRIRDPRNLVSFSDVVDAFPPKPEDKLIVNPADTEFGKFCEENSIYELFTEEYIDALADYLVSRFRTMSSKDRIIVLEVAAGNGKLTHFLQKKFQEKPYFQKEELMKKVKFVATDDYSAREMQEQQPPFPVENLDYRQAIEEHQPAIVLCSWMPSNEDWTPVFREAGSVEEYILIGPDHRSHGVVGTPETYDKPEGFVKVEKTDIKQIRSKNQFCKLDRPPFTPEDRHSTTVSFRRKT